MSLRVLLVSSWPVLTEGLKRILEGGLIEVVGVAQDTERAVALAASTLPNVAVIDVTPPGLDGLNIARRIREASDDTRVLLLTGEDDELDARDALDSGVWALVRRSNNPAMLFETILQAAAGEIRWDTPQRDGRRRTLLAKLSPRERQVLELIALGNSSASVGAELRISAKTVEVHRKKLMDKLGIHDVAGVVRFAIRLRVVEP